MEKFSSVGQKNMMGPGSFKYHLKIPKAKEFVINAVKNGEEVLSINELISRAVKRDKFCPFHVRSCIDKNGLIVDIPKTLQTIVVAHPYPLSQGPVIPPLDCMTEEKMTEREADMKKGGDTRTLSAEIFMDCGNFRHDSLYFTLIYNKK